jgi:hypothetical protein
LGTHHALYIFCALVLSVPFYLFAVYAQVQNQGKQTMLYQDPVFLAYYDQTKAALAFLSAVSSGSSKVWLLPVMLVLNFGLLCLNHWRRPCNVELINMVRAGAFGISFVLLLLANITIAVEWHSGDGHSVSLHVWLLTAVAVVLGGGSLYFVRYYQLFRTGRATESIERWHSAMRDEQDRDFFRLELYCEWNQTMNHSL